MTDREIDRLVAEKVMKLELVECRGRWMINDYTMCDDETSNPPSHMELPRYSTSIQAAWPVVEKLIEDNWDFKVANETGWYCKFVRVDGEGSFIETGNWPGSTAPMAICLAALKVVGEEVKQ